ncbi:hypothetical protein DFH09DRAFT_1204352 [Mycena vulgaris]|nr:hypothetical protein DFH09DRAFT_1204352 [Mycena vulgaris]
MAGSTASADSLHSRFSDIRDSDAGDESAGAKLWMVYISEAEKYDKALVEGWKSDMEGLLIFAGLFSASLTAFLVESYKSLTPDQGAITIALLAQISRQLDAQANAPVADLATLTAFHPTPSSLACNIFWFLSLGFSLSCALIATLVEQWARDFIQKTEMRPSPVIRARILSYLYFGLQRFGMHTTVAFLPLLLHASLILFFAGLVAFLHPINMLLMTIAAVMLGLIFATYAYLTVLPIYSSDCPYRTPLSAMTWALFLRLRAAFNARHKFATDEESTIAHHDSSIPKNMPTLTEAMMRAATQNSHERDQRDARAIVWTVESLTDNNELEPFVEALPDLIFGRRTYGGMIETLLEDPDIHLVSRIQSLLRSCDSGVLHPALQSRRRLLCIKALWSLANFVGSHGASRRFSPSFDVELLVPRPNDNSMTTCHLISASCLVRWCRFSSLAKVVRDVISMLEPDGSTITRQDLRRRLEMVQGQAGEVGYTEFSDAFSSLVSLDADEPLLIERSREVLKSFDNYGYDVLTGYLHDSAALNDMPYEFEATCLTIQPFGVRPNMTVQMKLKRTFVDIISMHADRLRGNKEVHQIDIAVDTILQLLQRNLEFMDADFCGAVTRYVEPRREIPQRRGLRQCDPKFIGGLITKHLGNLHHNHLEVVEQIWSLSLWHPTLLAAFDEKTIAAINAAPRFPISACVITVVKWHILMASADLPSEQLDSLMDRMDIPPPSTGDTPEKRWQEGHFALLVDFLEQYRSLSVLIDWTKNRAAETFDCLTRFDRWAFIPPPLQQRFAEWFLSMMTPPTVTSHVSMIQQIIDWNNLSSGTFDDPTARSTICQALATYSGTLSSGDEESRFNLRNIDILLAILNPIIPPGTEDPDSEATDVPTPMLDIPATPDGEQHHVSTNKNIDDTLPSPPSSQ